jgi:Mce-associated membrane protein
MAAAVLMVLTFDVVVTVRQTAAETLRESSADDLSSAFGEAPAQAERAAEQLLSYDYATLQADADEVSGLLTAEYAATFHKTVEAFLAEPAAEARGKVSATVMSSGVVSGTADEVDVLLFVDQTSVTAADPKGTTALNRVLMTMVRDGDRWLVGDVTAL